MAVYILSDYYITGNQLYAALRDRVDITVPTIAARDALQTYQRRWGMLVYVYADDVSENNGPYFLVKNNELLADNTNWEKFVGGSGGYEPKNSIEVDADELQLVGDEASPGNNKVYGTDGAGAKGWKDDPAGGGHTLQTPTGDALTARESFRGTGGIKFQNPVGVDYSEAVLDTTIKLGTGQAGDTRTIQADGTAADIDIALEPKGEGVIKSSKLAGALDGVIGVSSEGFLNKRYDLVGLIITDQGLIDFLQNNNNWNLENETCLVTANQGGVGGIIGFREAVYYSTSFSYSYKCIQAGGSTSVWVRFPYQARRLTVYPDVETKSWFSTIENIIADSANWINNIYDSDGVGSYPLPEELTVGSRFFDAVYNYEVVPHIIGYLNVLRLIRTAR